MAAYHTDPVSVLDRAHDMDWSQTVITERF
jgi:hypothetical protein